MSWKDITETIWELGKKIEYFNNANLFISAFANAQIKRQIYW